MRHGWLKTQSSRYYNQEDALLAEMFRRAACDSGQAQGGLQLATLQRVHRPLCCRRRASGMPLTRAHRIGASHKVIGQGSEFNRQQSVDFLFGTVLPMLNEEGRARLIQDVIAAHAGQVAVQRYAPDEEAHVAVQRRGVGNATGEPDENGNGRCQQRT